MKQDARSLGKYIFQEVQYKDSKGTIVGKLTTLSKVAIKRWNKLVEKECVKG